MTLPYSPGGGPDLSIIRKGTTIKPTPPALYSLIERIYNAILEDDPAAITTTPNYPTRRMLVRRHTRAQSPAQKALRLAAATNLMLRDSRGRFTRASPKLRAQLNAYAKRKKKQTKKKRGSFRKQERTILAELRRSS